MNRSVDAPMEAIKDHGGSLSRAARLFPDAPGPWLDLSTGINPHPYPFEAIPASAYTRLPEEARLRKLLEVAANAYGAPSLRHLVAAPGTQILLPLVAGLARKGRAAILSPTYAEHRRTAVLTGHDVVETADFDELAGAELAIVVNPNNPDGRIVEWEALLDLAARLRAKGGLLAVDEAFMDVGPPGGSLAPHADEGGMVILRSFGKVFGLAGVRLGFAIAAPSVAAELRARLGPWAVSGPAMEIGIAALDDASWRDAMRRQLAEEAAALDVLLAGAGLAIVGGTSLYRLARHERARDLFRTLGRSGILVRDFERNPRLLRFGLPGSEPAFARLREALAGWRQHRDENA